MLLGKPYIPFRVRAPIRLSPGFFVFESSSPLEMDAEKAAGMYAWRIHGL